MLKLDAPTPFQGSLNADMEDPLPPQRVNSASLFGRSRELIIEHHGREYRLRLTQNGKLILTA